MLICTTVQARSSKYFVDNCGDLKVAQPVTTRPLKPQSLFSNPHRDGRASSSYGRRRQKLREGRIVQHMSFLMAAIAVTALASLS